MGDLNHFDRLMEDLFGFYKLVRRSLQRMPRPLRFDHNFKRRNFASKINRKLIFLRKLLFLRIHYCYNTEDFRTYQYHDILDSRITLRLPASSMLFKKKMPCSFQSVSDHVFSLIFLHYL